MADSIYHPTPWPQLSQGDLLSGIEIREASPDGTERRRSCTVVVLSHGCDIDKPDTNAFLCAKTRPLSSTSDKYAAAIRAGGGANAMYLPAIGTLPESFVDFRLTFRVYRAALMEAIASGRRVASMSEAGQTALQIALFAFFSRVGLPPWLIRLLGAYADTSRSILRLLSWDKRGRI